MDKREFSWIRQRLGKTQKQLAQLLGSSLRAIQSFEQGWRNISVHTERQALFLLAMKESPNKRTRPCWAVRKCPEEIKQNCPAWEFKSGHLCWFINGTICHGKVQQDWKTKIKVCRRCEIFRSILRLP